MDVSPAIADFCPLLLPFGFSAPRAYRDLDLVLFLNGFRYTEKCPMVWSRRQVLTPPLPDLELFSVWDLNRSCAR
ncbi:unnamed protein product [Arabis nemorensis]|uniref:Uncharacterized protein n=1 Tax=Arabis nemorensis TaxID=586526 RepID=A0A565CA81_9BRAS|nr:unnamed protein product [Arabis nemorensis]